MGYIPYESVRPTINDRPIINMRGKTVSIREESSRMEGRQLFGKGKLG